MSEDLTIIWNRGRRQFERGDSVPLGRRLYVLRLADVDTDGDLDILVADRDTPELLSLTNKGSGQFAEPTALPGAEQPVSMEVADVDSDGIPDIVVARKDSGGIAILWGESPGVFAAGEVITGASRPGGISVADLDGDGDLDIAFAADTLYVVTNNGGRSFQSFGTAVRSSTSSPAPVDLNGDGAVDFVVGDRNQVRFLFNDGSGGFAGETSRQIPFPTTPQTFATADMDRDGDADVVVANGSETGSVSVLLNDGLGQFPTVSHETAGTHINLIAEDLDGDGWPDVVSTFPLHDEVVLLWNDTAGGLGAPPMQFLPTRATPREVATGDVDRDGDIDLVLATSSGVELAINENGAPVWQLLLEINNGAKAVALADLDGDTSSDIVSLSDELGVSVFLGDGTGSFSEPAQVFRSGDSRTLRLGDMNGDGHPDILVSDVYLGQIVILLGDGTGGFEAGETVPTDADQEPFSVGDLDGDGRMDIVDGAGGDLVVHFATAGGGFRRGLTLRIGATIDGLQLGDMDGDGDLDIVAAMGPAVRVYENRGNDLFLLSESADVGDNIRSLDLVDLELDGDLDIIVANRGSNDVALVLNSERSVLERFLLADAGFDPSHVVAADMDGDDLPDVVVSNVGSSSLSFILNRSGPLSTDVNANDIPDECETSFHRGDANRDGRLTIGDAVFVIDYALRGGDKPGCMSAADSNSDHRVDISDAIYSINYLFRDGRPPPPPGPPREPCGLEPSGEHSRPPLGCAAYEACAD